MALTSAEQLLIELINRARLDPLAEAARQGRALNDNVAPGQEISAAAKQVLAPNAFLHAAAEGHSQWMLDNGEFDHIGENGSTLEDRVLAAGYALTPPWSIGENISLQLSSVPLEPDVAIRAHFRELYLSAGHRLNTFAEAFREIGVSEISGIFTDTDGNVIQPAGQPFNASMLTENFALSGPSRFITGVAFDDTDANGFYSIGEGRGNISFAIGQVEALSEAAGGYALGTTETGLVTVTIDTGTTQGNVRVSMADGNVKIDAVNGTHLQSSADLTLLDGFTSAALLGIADLDLTGSGAANRLTGNAGHNRLIGDLGADTLEGGDGADTLNGGDGDDSIIGGATVADLRDTIFAGAGNDFADGSHGNDEVNGMGGNDTLLGGFGADTVIGGDGDDVITGSAFSDLIFGNAGADFVNGGFGNDRVNGGAGADRFFHLGIQDHGSDWIQDFTNADGDVLSFGQTGATAAQFQVNVASTPGAGDAGVAEAFVIYRPTGQIVWALVDGMGNDAINLQIAGSGEVFNLLA